MASLEAVMQGLKDKLDGLLELIPPGSNIALVDEPVHRNIGDHLIQWGTEKFFKQHGMKIAYQASTLDYRSSKAHAALGPGGLLVCQGGGHLGDLYPRHQRLREQVIRDFPNNRIVILPQSIYFHSTRAEQHAAAVFRSHQDLHICLRDQMSLELASDWHCPATYLLPDMSHALWPLEHESRGAANGQKVLYLIRKDKEGLPLPTALERLNDNFIDWHDLLGIYDTSLLMMIILVSAAGVPAEYPRRLLKWESQRLIQRATTLLAPVEHVVTSRLHGLLLALLLGKRVDLLDTLTGKTQVYYATWLKQLDSCRRLES